MSATYMSATYMSATYMSATYVKISVAIFKHIWEISLDNYYYLMLKAIVLETKEETLILFFTQS